MKKRGLLILMSILLTGSVLAGCSGSNNNGASSNNAGTTQTGAESSAAPQEKVTITMWNRIQKDQFDEAIAGFQEKYPNITVKLENMPEAGGDVAQFQAAINGNDLPDIFVRPTGYSMAQLVKLDKLHSLDEIFPAEKQTDYTDGTFAEGYGKIGGSVYTFPLYSSLHGALMMYYNKSVLEGLGYTGEDVPKTWDEFIAFGKELHEKSGGKTYALSFGLTTNYFSTFLMNQLAPPISPETGFNYNAGEYNYNTPGMVEAMEFFKKAYDEKVLHPATLETDTGKAYSMLKTGEVAFMFGGNWSGSYLTAPAAEGAEPFTAEDWGVLPIPTKDGGPSFQYFEGGSGEYLYVSKATKHWPEVKLFLQYLDEHLYSDIVGFGSTLPSKKMELLEDAKAPFEQYNQIGQMMADFKRLTPTVFSKNPEATEVMAQYSGYAPKDSVGTIFLGYMTGQLKDLPKSLQQLSDDSNAALKRAIEASGGKVKQEDFVFSDWVPGEAYAK
ncbi:ABC transporter substrate-binding protein [Paenibacillus macerans]|uniref:ABC transporter substrate-binding protein n=1 Tax=Paenibacillus macerans TaxID=44252 RepID=UPI003D31124B